MDDQTYSTEIARFATSVRMAVETFGATPEDAIQRLAEHAIKDAHDAQTRNGFWAHETTYAQIAEVGFRAAVASDILDGTISRPSVGNVRAALFAALNA